MERNMDGMIKAELATEIAKEAVSKTIRQSRELAARLARKMADDIEAEGREVTGADALRAFAAAMVKDLPTQ